MPDQLLPIPYDDPGGDGDGDPGGGGYGDPGGGGDGGPGSGGDPSGGIGDDSSNDLGGGDLGAGIGGGDTSGLPFPTLIDVIPDTAAEQTTQNDEPGSPSTTATDPGSLTEATQQAVQQGQDASQDAGTPSQSSDQAAQVSGPLDALLSEVDAYTGRPSADSYTGKQSADPFSPADNPVYRTGPRSFMEEIFVGKRPAPDPATATTPQQEGFYRDPGVTVARQVLGNVGYPQWQRWATGPRPTTGLDRLVLIAGGVESLPLLIGVGVLGLSGSAVLSATPLETDAAGGGISAAASQTILKMSIGLYMTAPRLWDFGHNVGASMIGGTSYVPTAASTPDTSVDQALMQLRDEAIETTRRIVADDLARTITTSPAKFGSLADAVFKAGVRAAQDTGRLPQSLQLTPASMNQPGTFGIDVWDPLTGRGWDLTTATVRQIVGHDLRYLGTMMPDGTIIQDVNPLVYTR
jgi:hypothetical protein